jgi:dTDP-4-amino-4,6-dideoxygalactose transaminase
LKKYYYNSHYLDSNDISTVIDSLKRDTLSQGSYQKLLEEKIKKRFNVKYCIAVSSATAGLHLAYKSLGLKKNDYIITSTMTWNATTNAAIFCNATSKLVDISEKNFCIDPKKLENFIIKAKKKT